MQIVFDARKQQANLAKKHGYDFAALNLDFFADSMVLPAKDGRFKAVGRLGTEVVAVIFAPLGREAIAVISMRDASRAERSIL